MYKVSYKSLNVPIMTQAHNREFHEGYMMLHVVLFVCYYIFWRLGMARVLKGSHSFTCTPRVYPLTQ